MGLETNDQYEGGATFLTVRMGTDAKGRKKAILAKRCSPEEIGAKQVFKANGDPALNKDGEAVYRLEFPALFGKITKLAKAESEYNGKTVRYLQVHVMDRGELYVLTLERGDRYWSDFLMRLPMIDLDVPVRLAPYAIEEDGKFNQGISMRQDDEKISRKWTKENDYKDGPPMAEQVTVNDEVQWDFGKRNKWLEERVVDPTAEYLEKQTEALAKADAKPMPKAAASAAAGDENDDDLPF